MKNSAVRHLSRRRRNDWQPVAWNLASAVIAVILLASAVLKVHQLASRPLIAATWLDQRWVLSVGIVYEIVLAMLLLNRFAPRFTWAATLGTFVFFAAVSTWKGLRGDASCGCFGTLTVWPWYTVALDLTLLALAVVCHPPLAGPLRPDIGDPRLAAAMGLSLLLSVPALWIAASYRPAPLQRVEQPVADVIPDAHFTWSLTPLHYELGPAEAGGSYSVVLALRNPGPAALHIDTLYCECSCMRAELLNSPVVDAGQSALVRLHCDIPPGVTSYRKRVLIRGNGDELVLTVSAELSAAGWGF